MTVCRVNFMSPILKFYILWTECLLQLENEKNPICFQNGRYDASRFYCQFIEAFALGQGGALTRRAIVVRALAIVGRLVCDSSGSCYVRLRK